MPHDIEQCRRAHAALRRVRKAITNYRYPACAWIATSAKRPGLPIMLHVRTGWAPSSMVETRGLGQTHQLPLIDIDHRLNLAGVVLAGGSLRDAVGATR